KAAIACVELCRALGNAKALQPLVAREVLPGTSDPVALDHFVRDAGAVYWHQTCSAKMGQDAASVVNSKLKVYGIDRLRIADGSVFPRIPAGNTMAPCVIVGEKAALSIRAEYRL